MDLDKELIVRRIFILCADPSDEANLQKKVEQKLLSPEEERPIFISLFGGPICLAYHADLPKKADTVVEDVRFAKKKFGVVDAVLIGHICRFYAEIPVSADEKKAKEDLAESAQYLDSRVCGLSVTALFDTSSGGRISFEEVPVGNSTLAG